MKGSYPLTRPKLHACLLELLKRPEVHLTAQTLKGDFAGDVSWEELHPPTDIYIRVNANAGDAVQFVIHELLHVVMFPMIVGRLDDTLEEVLIVAYELYMFEYVKKSPKRLSVWNSIIQQKMNEGKTDIPLEKQVDRSGV